MRSYPKTCVWRSEAYRRAVSTLSCYRCGAWGRSQCAHLGGLAHGKGRGLKVSDAFCAPLCGPAFMDPGCHQRYDMHEYEIDIADAIRNTVNRLLDAGEIQRAVADFILGEINAAGSSGKAEVPQQAD